MAVLAADGMEEAEIRAPADALQQAGACVDILGANGAVRLLRRHAGGGAESIRMAVDRSAAGASPAGYDAVLVPGRALEPERIQLDRASQDFVRAMQQAGKPVVCMPVASGGGRGAADKPEPVTTRRVWSLIRETVARWNGINAPRLGAALSYYTLLSIAPLLVVVVGIAGIVFGRAAAQSQIVSQIRDLVGGEGATAIQAMLATSAKPAAGAIAAVLGLLMLFFGASGVFVELRSALNDLWGVRAPETGVRGMIAARFSSFAIVVAIGFLLLVSLVVSAALAAAGTFMSRYLPLSEPMLHLLSIVVSLAVFTTVFALIYKVVPDAEVEWRDVWIGAAVTALLFSLGKFCIGLYLGKAAVGSAYGAAGSLVVLLVWVYYSAQIFFLGAEFTHIFAERHGSRAAKRCETMEEAG